MEDFLDASGLNDKVWEILNTVQANLLFIHSAEIEVTLVERTKSGRARSARVRRLPEILTLCILNAIVPNSALILVGGHGGGKTTLVELLGRMFTGESLSAVQRGILRGHPQLTEEKIVATLKPGKLLKEGVEEIVWREFMTEFWKIIDEVNRLTPYAQDILLSLLAEGKVKYFNETLNCRPCCVFATINPQDAGTFELALPFLDRFGMAIPISMPTSGDLGLILSSKDEKLYDYDEITQVPAILTREELMKIWNLVGKVPISDTANQFIREIVREFSACLRTSKGAGGLLQVGQSLCEGCHFNTKKVVCNKIISQLSVRAAKDMARYSRALAWLLNQDEVSIEIVEAIAPYVIWHRVKFVDREIMQYPFFGNKLEYTRDIIQIIKKNHVRRKTVYEVLENIKNGTVSDADIKKVELIAKNDLITQLDLLPEILKYKNKEYSKMKASLEKAYAVQDVEKLLELKNELFKNPDFPNRPLLLSEVSEYITRLTLDSFIFPFKYFETVCAEIAAKIPELASTVATLNDLSRLGPISKQVKSGDVFMTISTTGISSNAQVFVEVAGGPTAEKIKKLIEDLTGKK
ncbi:MAG: AAA family ATPase [Candidatus Helarchaeales archaeon]